MANRMDAWEAAIAAVERQTLSDRPSAAQVCRDVFAALADNGYVVADLTFYTDDVQGEPTYWVEDVMP